MTQAILPDVRAQINFPPIAHKGQPVVTTAMLAGAYGCSAKNIRDNFNNNRERFIEGKHFYWLAHGDLQAFRDCTENFGAVVPARTRNLTLWTERGALQHAKSIGTDETWAVYDVLVETFFRVVTTVAPTPLPRPSKRSDQERKSLTGLVSAWVGVAPFDYRTCWKQVNAHFGVSGVDELTVDQVKQACAWVQERINECAARPQALPAGRLGHDLVPAGPAPDWEAELTRIYDDTLRYSLEVGARLRGIDSDLGRVLGPLYKDVARTIMEGTPMISADRGIEALHETRRHAMEMVELGLKKLSGTVWHAEWFAKAMKMRQASIRQSESGRVAS